MVFAIFKHKSDMVRIKEGGPWHCMDTVVLIHDWCPDLAPEEFIMNKLGVWAQFHNLPVGVALNDKEISEKLVKYIGKFVKERDASEGGAMPKNTKSKDRPRAKNQLEGARGDRKHEKVKSDARKIQEAEGGLGFVTEGVGKCEEKLISESEQSLERSSKGPHLDKEKGHFWPEANLDVGQEGLECDKFNFPSKETQNVQNIQHYPKHTTAGRFGLNQLKRVGSGKEKVALSETRLKETMGKRIRGEWQMMKFRETVDDCGLYDLGYKGLPFTFSNRRAGFLEMKARLDRAFGNMEWKRLFSGYVVTHLISSVSDHLPLLSCKEDLKQWNSDIFGKVHKRISSIKKELEDLQSKFITEEVIKDEAQLRGELDEWLAREELTWRQRSRVEWLKEGDSNTKYFHSRASQRRKRNTVNKIKDSNGSWITDEIEMCKEAVNYFSNIFTTSYQGNEVNWEESLSIIDSSNSSEQSEFLRAPFTQSEVQNAIFQIGATKAPGPDGYSALFYHEKWRLIKEEVTQSLRILNEGGLVNNELNETLITLVPKTGCPITFNEFRPISLCNVAMKVITKALANRLKEVLQSCISPNQGTFVPGRLILDNILIAHELMNYMRTRKDESIGY
ncbi:hypothetical protein QQ045_005545 [Rhodiola kirilowii]